jgi:UPF0755 protein
MTWTVKRIAGAVLALGVVCALSVGLWFARDFSRPGAFETDTTFVVPRGASVSSVAAKLEAEGLITSASRFKLQARLFGGSAPVRAGEYQFPAGSSASAILESLQSGKVLVHRVTFPEGTPAVIVVDLLNAEEALTGAVDVPPEGALLPDTYTFERGDTRQSIVDRAQTAMDKTFNELWEKRQTNLPFDTKAAALTLASIVEKETSKPDEYRRVAGVYVNRLRQGMMLQADPTVIYPVTKGRPLGRRIRQSELDAVNDYNTYAMVGLPKGPIAMPGRAALEATLNPEAHDYIFFVADGTGGHIFSRTYAEHNANVQKWRQLRREKGF